jgi:hypothetical protein
MSIKKRAPGPSPLGQEPDRLQEVMIAAAQSKLVNEVRREMNNIATQSVREALRSDNEVVDLSKTAQMVPQ